MIDDHLSFKAQILNTEAVGFYFQNKSCFSSGVKQKLVELTVLLINDYGDVLYMNAPAQCRHGLDSVHHGTLRFIINCGVPTLYLVHQSKIAIFVCALAWPLVCPDLQGYP